MWVVYKGHVCIMMYYTRKKKYVYIREEVWDKMSPEQREKYV